MHREVAICVDWLVLYAAIATGELVRHNGPSPALLRNRAALSELLEARRDIGGDMFSQDDGVAQAHRLVLEAELARAFGHDDEVDRWRRLADVPEHCGEVGDDPGDRALGAESARREG